MSTRAEHWIWHPRGLRTRYAPRSQVGRGLIVMAPWINLVLLLLFFAYVPAHLIVQPGILVELPPAPLQSGAPYGPTAVVLSHGGRELVFFDDQPYAMDSPQAVASLKRALRRLVQRTPDSTLTIEADGNVLHRTMVGIYNTAVAAGVQNVHIATRAESLGVSGP